MTKNDSAFFVRLNQPVEMRKELLKSSRSIIQCLQRYENLNSLRALKLKEVSALKSQTREIARLLGVIKKDFPVFTAIKKKTVAAQTKEKKPGQKKEAVKENKSKEVNELEGQLKDIEKKLSALS